jgi:hypothetical protein
VTELAAAVGLLVPRVSTVAAAASLVLLLGFSGYIWRVVRRTGRAACGCFGSHDLVGSASGAFLRNALLATLAALALTRPVVSRRGISFDALGVLLATWTIPVTILSFAISRLPSLHGKRNPPKVSMTEGLQLRLADVTLPLGNGGVVRVSDLGRGAVLVLCIHRDCEECESLVELAWRWKVATGNSVLVAAPRGVSCEMSSAEFVVALDQTFEVGRACGAEQPPVACIMEWKGRAVPYAVQGHRNARTLLLNATRLTVAEPLPTY